MTPPDESGRLRELWDMQLLDTPPEERFDRLTRLAQRLFDVRTTLVSLVDHDRQWFKSRQGLDALQTPRSISFCGHAILADGPFVIQDARLDPRFADNPLVTGPLAIRFYAGMPLQGPRGHKVGTLCLIDPRPREFGADDVAALRDLAALVMLELANRELTQAVETARETAFRLRQITDTVPALIAYRDHQQRFVFHNKAYEEVLNLGFEQIHGHTIGELLSPQAYAPVHDMAEKVLRGDPVRYERTYVTHKGESRIYDMQYFPRYGDGADADKVIGYFSLGADITELKRIDRMKTEFISTVSHELRTPLTSIRGSLGLVLGGVAGDLPEAAKGLVDIANTNCERLIRLINDILDSEKIESGHLRLELKAVDIVQLVRQAVDVNQGFADQHQVTLVLQTPAAPVAVQADSDRLMQVVTNLLSNAVKFSPTGGQVTLAVLRSGQGVRLEVRDTGPGIPEAFQGRIFQKFSQADASDTRQKGGTGLGLNISRALVRKMGGQIGFASQNGRGTVFFCEFPELPAPGAAPLPIAPCAVQPAASRPRILHVEDDPDIRRVVAAMVQGSAVCTSAATLGEARARLAEGRFDLVMLDLALDDGSGWSLFDDIDALNPRPPVIVFSASDKDPAHASRRVESVLVKSQASDGQLRKAIQSALRGAGHGQTTDALV